METCSASKTKTRKERTRDQKKIENGNMWCSSKTQKKEKKGDRKRKHVVGFEDQKGEKNRNTKDLKKMGKRKHMVRF